jgi:DNA-binding PadR family transcriptional regulator
MGPWGPRARFFGPGEVRLALLSLLGEGPQHGYELMKQLESRSGGVYRASAGTVYPTLQQLEDEGLVSSTAEGGKRVYSLTPAGEAELAEEGTTVRRIWRRAEQWGDWRTVTDPDAAELMRPAFRVVRAAFRAAARSDYDPDTMDRIREKLERARDELRDLGRARED